MGFSLNKAEMSQLKKAVLLSTVRSPGKHFDAALNSSTYLILTKLVNHTHFLPLETVTAYPKLSFSLNPWTYVLYPHYLTSLLFTEKNHQS